MFHLTVLTAFLSFICLVCAAEIPRKTNRIVGGEEISIALVPHQASLIEKGNHVCGCSIISPTHILTAAHCVDDINPKSNDLKVRAGSSKLNADGVVKDVNAFRMHPSYNPSTMEYDIAVLSLKSPFEFSSTIQKIGLSRAPPNDGSQGLVSGWGLMKNNGRELSPVLKKTQLKILSQDRCSKTPYGNNIKQSMYCGRGKGTDACEGDSGGPMTDLEASVQIGVVSFGFDCASEKFPGVYTSIYECLPFIEKMMKNM